MLRHRQMAGRDHTFKCWVSLAYGGWVATALRSDSRVAKRDRNEGTVFIFHRWYRSRCSLRTHPGKESGTADRRFTRPLGDGAWRAVRDVDSDEEARRFACRIHMPCR